VPSPWRSCHFAQKGLQEPRSLFVASLVFSACIESLNGKCSGALSLSTESLKATNETVRILVEAHCKDRNSTPHGKSDLMLPRAWLVYSRLCFRSKNRTKAMKMSFNVTSTRGHFRPQVVWQFLSSAERVVREITTWDTQVLTGRIRPFLVSGLHYLARWSPDSIVALFYAQLKSEPSTLRN
jgi:hypothetical protein